MPVLNIYLDLMGIKHLGARRILMIAMLFGLIIWVVVAYNEGLIADFLLFIRITFGFIVGFAVSIRLLIETFKWVREGFKKGYDV